MEPHSQDLDASILTVDLSAIGANYLRLARTMAPASLGAVVKADAYGLGVMPVVRRLADSGCAEFFVAHLAEALQIRPELAPDVRIYVLNGLLPGTERTCAEAGIIPVINSLDQAARWIRATRSAPRLPAAAIQIDSGMSRLGLSEAEVHALASSTCFDDELRVSLVISHLACADDPNSFFNEEQLTAFDRLASFLPAARRSIANSDGAFLSRRFRLDLVRAGLALYGCKPHASTTLRIDRVVRLTAPVIQVRELTSGQGVGYGLTYRTARPSRVAALAIGYADGLPRHLGNRGAVYWGPVRLPIIGRVSMDSLSVDVSALPADSPQPGEQLELIGVHQSIEEVAGDAETVPYEILTRFGGRLSRRWVAA